MCRWQVSAICALHGGSLLGFEAPVLDEDQICPESGIVPPCLGSIQFGSLNAFFCSKLGQLHCVLGGSPVQWQVGIRSLHCERAFGGHWLFGVGHWNRASSSELSRVKAIRGKQLVVSQPAPPEGGGVESSPHKSACRVAAEV